MPALEQGMGLMQVAGVEAAGREHDPVLFDLGSEIQTRIDIRQAGEHLYT
jgi:hypothetical protein